MARVSCRVDFDESILAELDRAAIEALKVTADATLTDIRNAGVMPRDTGHLQNDQTTVVEDGDNISIVTAAEQAERLYFHPEYNFNKTKNANAGSHWFEPWIDGEKKNFIRETYAEMLKRTGGL